MLNFLSVIAVKLLQVTYLHRTQPDAPAIEILNSIQMEVLKAGTSPNRIGCHPTFAVSYPQFAQHRENSLQKQH
jgi:hypothetical protein